MQEDSKSKRDRVYEPCYRRNRDKMDRIMAFA
jgi:hypothetical protein